MLPSMQFRPHKPAWLPPMRRARLVWPSLRPSSRPPSTHLTKCISSKTQAPTKEITSISSNLEVKSDLPSDARLKAGYQPRQVQRDGDPADWNPMRMVGQGVREIRIREASGTFRVIYLASLVDRILVLHAFQKKTQQTTQHDVGLAAARLKA